MLLQNKVRRFTTVAFKSDWSVKGASALLFALALLIASVPYSFGQDSTSTTTTPPQTPPKTWIDADTGHRVTRLTDEPNSEALFFNKNAFTPDGKDMIYVSPGVIHSVNLTTFKTRIITAGKIANIAVGTKTRRVFFTKTDNTYLYAVDIDSRQVTRLSKLIPVRGVIFSVNADETMLIGTSIEDLTAPDFNGFHLKALQDAHAEAKANPTATRPTNEEVKQRAEKMRLEARIPEDIFTVNLQTGQVNTILKGTDWLNRVQFSPTDPNLIMYVHEGHSTDVDRIWTIHADGTQNQLIHQRTIKDESAMREFWSRDGKTIWYELQKPKDQNYDLVGYDITTGTRKIFHMDKTSSSMYYNSANFDTFFCGSGRRSESVHGEDVTEGQTLRSREWIEALYPIYNSTDSSASSQYANWFHSNNATSGDPNVKYTGWLRRERLVNLYKNDYKKIEPNVRVSPDNKLVIFTSNMFGPTYVFAVEVN